MELSFKKGDYDQFINMVNISKELLNDSILLRSIKDKVDTSIAKSQKEELQKELLTLVLALFFPLIIILVYLNIMNSISWRVVPLMAILAYVIYFRKHSNTPNLNNLLYSENKHDDDPKPLKYLEMKIDYLQSLYSNTQTSLDLVRWFFIVFFPFLCYFLFELVFGTAPFNHTLLGLFISYLIGGVFWFFYFKKDVDRAQFNHEKLNRYKAQIVEISGVNTNVKEE